MDKDIEILENKIQVFRYMQNTLDEDEKELYVEDFGEEEIQAIENLINKNKDLEERMDTAIEMLEEQIKYCKQEAEGSLNNEICHIALKFYKSLLSKLKESE